MILRDYQEKSVLEASTLLASGKRKIIFHLPTGAGKTVCFSAISKRYIDRSEKSVLILVHRIELLQQTRRTLFAAFDISSQVIIAGMKHVPKARIYVGMIESVFRRMPQIKDIGLVIVDEAHLANFFKIHDFFTTQFMIGFTATPISANKKKPLKNYYEDIVCSIQIPELIKLGSLAQNITYTPRDCVDRASLTVKNGEFDDHEMAVKFSSPRYVNNTVEAYKKYAGTGSKALIFNVTIDHSKQVNAAFLSAGINSMHVDGNMGLIERKNILQWFENTPGSVLNNVGIATTGTDIPSIETVIINKSTMSMPLLSQMCGRGGRTTAYKSAFTIIDLGGNVLEHGDFDSERDWKDIFHNPRKIREVAGVAPCKSCPQCEAIVAANARLCKYCGYEYPSKDQALEEQLSDFIVVTNGIDVKQVIAANKNRKEYYPFFKIGKDLAISARKEIPAMTDEIAVFILLKYSELAKEWCHASGKRYNQWHQERAREHLFAELSQRFKGWQVPQTVDLTMMQATVTN